MGEKEGMEREEPGGEPDVQNGNVDRAYVCTDRISASSSSSVHRQVSSPPRLFYRQTFRNETSLRLSSRSFREPADNQHKSRASFIEHVIRLLSRGSHSWTPPENCFRSARNDGASSR